MSASNIAARAWPARRAYALGTLVMTVLTSGVARSESVNWNTSPPARGNPSCPTGGPWSNGNCWIYDSHAPPLRIPPRTGDTASIFKVGGTVTLDTNIDLQNFAVSGGPFKQGSYRVQASGEAIGLAGAPTTWYQTGGSNTSSALGLVAGTYDLSSGTVTTGNFGVANAVGGSATFNQSSGTTVTITSSGFMSSGALAIGAAGIGRYNMAGGNLLANFESIGTLAGSDGYFNQSGGVNTITGTLRSGFLGTLFVGVTAGTNGKYTMSGAQSSLKAGVEIIGIAGSGKLTQSDGLNTSEMLLVSSGGVGIVEQSGGTSSLGDLKVGAGRFGKGLYSLSGDARLNANAETIGSGLFVYATPGAFIQLDHSTNTVKGTLLINDTDPVSRYTNIGGLLQAGYIVNHGLFELFGGNVKTGSLDNFGTFTYANGSLQANVTNESGALFKTAYAGMRPTLILNGSFDNRAEATLDVSGTTKLGAFSDAGPVVFDPATAEVSQITVSATGYLEAGGGSELKVDGDFVNQSTQRALWNTSQATLDFSGPGTHRFVLNGTAGAGAGNNYAWGTLALDPGSILDLMAGTGDALYVGTLQGVDTAGSRVSNIEGSANVVLYYDAADNPTLRGSYRLVGGGELIPTGGTTGVPEPGTLGLLAAGLALSRIGSRRMRRPRNAG